MDKNICDNTLVFGSCYIRSCIEVPSLTAGRAKWKAFLINFLGLKVSLSISDVLASGMALKEI